MKGKRWIAGIVSATMLLSVTPIYAFAADDELGDAEDAYVTSDIEVVDDKHIEATFTISENAPADEELEIHLSQALKETGWTAYPGDLLYINYTINNLSENSYQYQDGSFELRTAGLEGRYEENDFTGFYAHDGQNLPIQVIGAIPLTKPIIELIGKDEDNITAMDIINLYDSLGEKGYTGEEALTQYFLDYFGEEDNTTYNSIFECYLDHLDELSLTSFGFNGYYPIKQETLEEINENGTANQKKIIDYAVLTNGSKVQFKWPEEELAAISYDVFYDSLLAVAFGEDIDNLNPNYSGSNEEKEIFFKHGIYDYEDQSGRRYQEAEGYIKSCFQDNILESNGQTETIESAWALSGPDTGNSFMDYQGGWYNAITLEPIPHTGALTIEKTVTGLPADLIPDSFAFDVISGEDTAAVAEVTVSDEDGDGIFTGIGTVENLPYGEYTITEQPEEVADYHCETAITPETITIDEETPDIAVAVTNNYNKEQVTITVHYYIEGTTTQLREDTVLVVDKNSNYDVSNYPASIGDYDYESTTGDDLTGLADEDKTIIIYYERDSGSGGGGHHNPPKDDDDDDEPADEPDEEIPEEEVPLAETPWLNTVDHYAYIVGYPEDYVTGQPTEDESRWPIKPQANITRAEVATIFFRLLTDEARDQFWMTTNDFPDVAADAWYNNAISTMVNAGIIQGYEDGTFRPNDNITRAEFAAIASRFMSSGYDVEEDLFTDISGHWARENINDAAMTKWINGYPDGTFLPDNDITRAEAVTLVNNVLRRAPDADHMLDSMIKWPDNMDTSAWYYEAMQEATNSHDYDMFEGAEYETWTALEENRDWAALEQDWMNAHRGGGEVM